MTPVCPLDGEKIAEAFLLYAFVIAFTASFLQSTLTITRKLDFKKSKVSYMICQKKQEERKEKLYDMMNTLKTNFDLRERKKSIYILYETLFVHITD